MFRDKPVIIVYAPKHATSGTVIYHVVCGVLIRCHDNSVSRFPSPSQHEVIQTVQTFEIFKTKEYVILHAMEECHYSNKTKSFRVVIEDVNDNTYNTRYALSKYPVLYCVTDKYHNVHVK